jgi:NAD(P)-dependent dehydrogenase (short-subunit alcohol dehydrogenase family)
MNNSQQNVLRSADAVGRLFRLDGRTALLTGGGGFLGGAIGRGLGLAGASIILADLIPEKLEASVAALRELGIEARGVAFDACDKGSVERAIDALAADGVAIDILVNAAGGNQPGATTAPPDKTIFDLDPKALRGVIELNLFGGAMIPALAVGRHMAAHGRPCSIINISSVAAALPLTRVAGYAAAKAAVANFTQWLATHFALELKLPIRVNALMPGFLLTDQNRFLLTNADGSMTPRGATILNNTPMGRYGDPDELIGACIYLASEAASFVTGTTLTVDGGFTAFSGV